MFQRMKAELTGKLISLMNLGMIYPYTTTDKITNQTQVLKQLQRWRGDADTIDLTGGPEVFSISSLLSPLLPRRFPSSSPTGPPPTINTSQSGRLSIDTSGRLQKSHFYRQSGTEGHRTDLLTVCHGRLGQGLLKDKKNGRITHIAKVF